MQGFVYVIEAEKGIKIGWTQQPEKRLVNLENQYGEIYVWAWEPGTRSDESWLHRKYADHHITGDWFERSDELYAACEEGRLLAIDGGLCKFSRVYA